MNQDLQVFETVASSALGHFLSPLFSPGKFSRAQVLMASPQANLPQTLPGESAQRKLVFSSLGFQGLPGRVPSWFCACYLPGPCPGSRIQAPLGPSLSQLELDFSETEMPKGLL